MDLKSLWKRVRGVKPQPVTGEAIWEALLADPGFQQTFPASQRETLRPFVEGIPEALAEHLGRIVTLKSLLEAKAAFIQHLLESGFIEALVSTIPDEQLYLFTREEWAEALRKSSGVSLTILEQMIADLPRYLRMAGVTEEEAMLDPRTGLSPENLERYRAGTLTIGDLLLTQPALIVKQSSD